MFRSLKYNPHEKLTVGELNIPVLSLWGQHFEELNQICLSAVTENDFQKLSYPKNVYKEKYFLKFEIQGKGPSPKQEEKIQDLFDNWLIYSKEISLKTEKYYRDLHIGYQGLPEPNDAVLSNFFKITSVFLKPRSIIFYADSVFDTEHGLVIELKGTVSEVYQPY